MPRRILSPEQRALKNARAAESRAAAAAFKAASPFPEVDVGSPAAAAAAAQLRLAAQEEPSPSRRAAVERMAARLERAAEQAPAPGAAGAPRARRRRLIGEDEPDPAAGIGPEVPDLPPPLAPIPRGHGRSRSLREGSVKAAMAGRRTSAPAVPSTPPERLTTATRRRAPGARRAVAPPVLGRPFGDIATETTALTRVLDTISNAGFEHAINYAGVKVEHILEAGKKATAATRQAFRTAIWATARSDLGPKVAAALAPVLAVVSTDAFIAGVVVVGSVVLVAIYAVAIVRSVQLIEIWKRGDMLDAKTGKPVSRRRAIAFVIARVVLAIPRFAVHVVQMIGHLFLLLDPKSKASKAHRQLLEDLKTKPLDEVDRLVEKPQDAFETIAGIKLRMSNLGGA